jgi:electron transfer flavoprotein alpha subunit
VKTSPAAPGAVRAAVWVIERCAGQGTIERLGDARRVADALSERVGVIIAEGGANSLIAHGADLVVAVQPSGVGPATFTAAVERTLSDQPVRLVYASHGPEGRALAARLAVRSAGVLVAPALLVRRQAADLVITGLDHAGRKARGVVVPQERSAVVTLRDGVGQPSPADAARHGMIVERTVPVQTEPIVVRRRIPIDPATADIRQVRRLVSGGRGVGSAQGFDQLRRVARLLDAGVAASRVAVDLGWIDYERQVGQTGKTVRPDLYLACGISGATHHLDGMSGSGHIIAINTDPEAPLLARAHLGLVADLAETLKHLEQALTDERRE